MIRIIDELLDVFWEHGQPLIFLRISEISSEFDVLRIDDHCVVALSCPRDTCLDSLGLVETTTLIEPTRIVRTQHLVLLGTDLSPRVLQDLL